jgi:OmpA-OmpF porin, OOP family
MKTSVWAVALMLGWLSVYAHAQDKRVLKGDEVTKSALIDSLAPRNRSIGSAKQAILITFETNSTELTSEAKGVLEVVAQAMSDSKLSEYKFTIEGHADPRGSAELNLQLSEGRAEAVRQYLVQSQNIGDERLRTVGKGSTEPLNEKNPAAPENRRVVFITEF